MSGHMGKFATPTEQGRGVVGGPVPKGTEQETAACVRRVKLESRNPAEAAEFLQMLGIVAPDHTWVATSRNHRKRVAK